MCFVSGSHSSHGILYPSKMPVIWWKADSDKRFPLGNVYGTEYDSLNE